MKYLKKTTYGSSIFILLYLSITICYHSTQADQYQCMIFEEMKIMNRLIDMMQTLFSEENHTIKDLINSYDYHYQQVKITTYLFVGLSIIILCFFAFNFWKMNTEKARITFIRWGVFICMLLLIVGIVAPFLKIVVSKDFGELGPVVFKYNTKSIVTTITHLSKSNLFLCVLIFICSLIIPFFKLFFTYLVTCGINTQLKIKCIKMLQIIGKWAMTDVFAVAILLTFLSMDGKDGTKCILDIGFYFFTAYCMLSFCSVFLIKERQENKTKL